MYYKYTLGAYDPADPFPYNVLFYFHPYNAPVRDKT